MPMDVLLKEIGIRVKAIRKGKPKTQEELAGEVDCDVRTIQRIENGEEGTCFPLLGRIAEALNVDVEMIVEASKRPLPAPGE